MLVKFFSPNAMFHLMCSIKRSHYIYCELKLNHHVIRSSLAHQWSTMVTQNQDPEINSLVRNVPQLFSEGVGMYNSHPHKIRIHSDAMLHHSQMQEPPIAYAKMALDEIESMLKSRLIEQTNTSDRIVPVHYVKKEGHVIRVTIY